MTTATYLGSTGIVLHGDADNTPDQSGVVWTSSGSGPFAESPQPREVTGERVNADGFWDATEFYGARRGSLEGLAKAPTHEVLHAAEQRFKAAVNLGFDLRHVEPGFDRTVRARRSGMVLWTEITDTIARYSAPILMPDPVLYSTAVRTASTGFPTTIGGLSLPTAVPFQLDAVSSSGDMNLINAGNATAWPSYRIDPSGTHPVVDPVIVDTTTGRAMRFAITIAPGEWLTINTHTHEVLGNGDPGAPRRNTFHGDWFGVNPGNNTIRYAGASGAGSTLSATWHDTDI